MRRTAAAAIAIAIALLFSLPSLGFAEFQDIVHAIETDLQDRIAEIAGLPSPTPGETKESKGLEKALDTLDAYMDGTGKNDLGIVAKALGTIHGTGTQDGGLNATCPEALGQYDGFALDEGDLAADVRSRIASPEGQAKVTAGIDKADSPASVRPTRIPRPPSFRTRAPASAPRSSTFAPTRIRAPTPAPFRRWPTRASIRGSTWCRPRGLPRTGMAWATAGGPCRPPTAASILARYSEALAFRSSAHAESGSSCCGRPGGCRST